MLDKSWIKNLDIESPNLMSFLKECLLITPKEFKKAKASSTGKYHPFFSCLEGGLLHGHTRYAIMFVKHLCELYQLSKYETEQMIIAMFLHDSFKGYTKTGKWGYTTREHAYVAYEKFQNIPLKDYKMMDGTVLSGKKAKENILLAIRFHMAQWSHPKQEKELAIKNRWLSKYVLIIQTSDYLSAQKDIPEFILGLHDEKILIEKSKEINSSKNKISRGEM